MYFLLYFKVFIERGNDFWYKENKEISEMNFVPDKIFSTLQDNSTFYIEGFKF